MLVELGLVEQRLKAVHEVLDGVTVVEVAERYGVVRQTVHTWLKNYASDGMAGLVDKASKPESCPHQMPATMEARIVELRRAHPRWGPQRILDQLRRDGETDLPGRSSVYRCLVRHKLIDPQARKRRKSDYKRWERSRPMELWQMDVVGGVMLADGWKAATSPTRPPTPCMRSWRSVMSPPRWSSSSGPAGSNSLCRDRRGVRCGR